MSGLSVIQLLPPKSGKIRKRHSLVRHLPARIYAAGFIRQNPVNKKMPDGCWTNAASYSTSFSVRKYRVAGPEPIRRRWPEQSV
jgi:hypothetical protein